MVDVGPFRFSLASFNKTIRRRMTRSGVERPEVERPSGENSEGAVADFGRYLDEIFDAHYYVNNCGQPVDLSHARLHFDEVGDQRLVSPSPLFSPVWYSHAHRINAGSSSEALLHYATQGVQLGFDPHPLFSSVLYRSRTTCELNSDPLLHYLRHSQHQPLVSPTPYFSPSFYWRLYGDVATDGANPLLHYLVWGWRERRLPNPYFNVSWYLTRYPDIASADIEPLQHFVAVGYFEGRQPHHLIDLEYYLAGAPDVAATGYSAFQHFTEHGDREGRSPHPLFDPSFYRANGPIIGEVPAFAHYVEIGARGMRSPCPAFDPMHYITHNPDEHEEPLLHYLLADAQARRHVHPLIDAEYQIQNSERSAQGVSPLIDYVQFRSHYAPEDLRRGATFIPKPKRALAGRKNPSGTAIEVGPKVSVLVPCYKSDLHYLDLCIKSIVAQDYENWELILVDDGSPDETTWPALQRYGEQESRIRPLKLPSNQGISAATNLAVHAATGEYLALVDHDDVLVPHALSRVVENLILNSVDVVYSDQAYITPGGVVDQPFFKPDWSPALFTGAMYVGHLLVVRTSLAISAGLFRSKFDGCQDFEFMLRVSELTSKISHIPEVLYHWRRAEGSVAANSDAKGKIEPKQAAAVTEHFERIGFRGRPEISDRVPHRLLIQPLARCSGMDVDVVVGGPAESPHIESLEAAVEMTGARIRSLHTVGWNTTPATAARAGVADLVVFLDPLVTFVDGRWLDYLLMYAECSDVAFAAPHIYTPEGRVVAAGLVALQGQGLVAAHSGAWHGNDGEAGSLLCDREVVAVGGTCALVTRSKLEILGGFSALYSGVDGAVRDASYRARKKCLRNIALSSRLVEMPNGGGGGRLQSALDTQFFRDCHYSSWAEGDPYYNPSYSRESADFLPG